MLESTYGDRNHRSLEDTLDEFRDIFRKAAANRGNVLVPAFAVGRTKEVIFRLGELYQAGELKQNRVFLDSPMGLRQRRFIIAIKTSSMSKTASR